MDAGNRPPRKSEENPTSPKRRQTEDVGTHNAEKNCERKDQENVLPGNNTKDKTIVVLHSKSLRTAAREHATFLKNNEMNASVQFCPDIQTFENTNADHFHIMVDAFMCSMLMEGEELCPEAKAKFHAMENSDGQVYVVNKLAKDYDQLHSRIPLNIRCKWEETSMYASAHSAGYSVEQCGMKGESKSFMSYVVGENRGNSVNNSIYLVTVSKEEIEIEKGEERSSIHTKRSVQTVKEGEINRTELNKVYTKLGKPEDANDPMLEDIEKQKHKLQTRNVEKVEVSQGCIMITFTVTDSQLITQEWIHSQLRILFDDILQHYACEGESVSVVVERCQLYKLQIDEQIHEECISRDQHEKQIELLNAKVIQLEDDNKQLRECKLSESPNNGRINISEDKPNEHLPTVIQESYHGNMKQVEIILSKNVNIDTPGPLGRTAVMMAVQNGKTEMVKFLKERGCDMSVRDDNKNNILHVACLGGSIETVKYILSLDTVDINRGGEKGMTAIMMAANEGYDDIFNLLFTKGCDLSVVDVNGNNLFHLASHGGSINITKFLLSKESFDLNDKGEDGRTAVMKAASKGHTELVRLLSDKGSDLSMVDDDGNNILHIACIAGSLDVVQEILRAGTVDIESKGKYGWTPVMMAAENGHYKVFKVLVKKGCDLTLQDSNGNNIFHTAAIGGNVDIVRYLLENTVPSKEKQNHFGNAPVDIAKKTGKVSLVNLLRNLAQHVRSG